MISFSIFFSNVFHNLATFTLSICFNIWKNLLTVSLKEETTTTPPISSFYLWPALPQNFTRHYKHKQNQLEEQTHSAGKLHTAHYPSHGHSSSTTADSIGKETTHTTWKNRLYHHRWHPLNSVSPRPTALLNTPTS